MPVKKLNSYMCPVLATGMSDVVYGGSKTWNKRLHTDAALELNKVARDIQKDVRAVHTPVDPC